MRSSSPLSPTAWVGCLLGCLACTGPDQPGHRDAPSPPPITTSPAERPEPPTPPAEAPDDPVAAPVAAQGRYALVRVDPSSFEETEIGRVEFDTEPPFTARALAGGDELEAFVAAVNEVGEFHYSDGTPLARTERGYFEFLRREWIETERGLSLRIPSNTDAVTRYTVVVVEGDQLRALGTVERNDVDYLRVVDGPRKARAQLGALLTKANQIERRGIEVAPPTGKPRGSYTQIIERGTPVSAALLRDQLLAEGALLLPAGLSTDQAITVLGAGPTLWMPGGLSSTPVTPPTLLSLSGPPGGPLGVRVLGYDDVAYDDAGLLAYVQAKHGAIDPEFEIGAATTVEIAGRPLRARSYRTGSGRARTTHLIALWPDGYERAGRSVESYGVEGIAIELSLGGELEPAQMLAHAQLGVVAASLRR